MLATNWLRNTDRQTNEGTDSPPQKSTTYKLNCKDTLLDHITIDHYILFILHNEWHRRPTITIDWFRTYEETHGLDHCGCQLDRQVQYITFIDTTARAPVSVSSSHLVALYSQQLELVIYKSPLITINAIHFCDRREKRTHRYTTTRTNLGA